MKKGKVPAALAKYWKTHKRKSARKVVTRKVSRKKRASNPAAPKYCLEIRQPGGDTKGLRYCGGKFSNHLPSVIFPTMTGAQALGNLMLKKFPSLRKYQMLVVPIK